jgi:hypothetical protein
MWPISPIAEGGEMVHYDFFTIESQLVTLNNKTIFMLIDVWILCKKVAHLFHIYPITQVTKDLDNFFEILDLYLN